MRYRIMAPLAIALAVLLSPGAAVAKNKPGAHSQTHTISKPDFKQGMRKLWEDHITWTRLYIISALADLPDKDQTATRLLQNQTDIGNAIKPFYGDAAGDKLTSLLKDHILIAADLVAAAKSGNTEKSNEATARWNANADQIAEFLSGANPKSWSFDEMKSMMHEHLAATTAEVIARLHNDWTADVQAYDKVHTQILGMADMLSSGIIHQFQKRFS